MADAAILVVCELREDAPSPLTLELLALARELAGASAAVCALLIAPGEAAAQALIEGGADRVYCCPAASADYEGEVWLPNAERCVRELAPAAVLIGHTPAGADLAPRLAFRLQTGVATGCVAVEAQSGRLTFTRACYGGNVRETISFPAGPAVATVKAGVGVAKRDAQRRGEILRIEPQAIEPRVRVIARDRDRAEGQSLEDAKVIVAGGRGLEGAEGFRVLEELAQVLGAAVGSSRVPCDLGWVPHSWQIGLTGKTVTPDLYFAVGISGAGHHMAGCGNAKTIVAINTDPEAAIFRDARFGIVGDYRKVVPALIEALKTS